jgi:hypothetical protein
MESWTGAVAFTDSAASKISASYSYGATVMDPTVATTLLLFKVKAYCRLSAAVQKTALLNCCNILSGPIIT